MTGSGLKRGIRSAFVAALVLGAAVAPAQERTGPEGVKPTRYFVKWIFLHEIEKDLNALAAKGWRLHTILPKEECAVPEQKFKLPCFMVVLER